MLRLQKFENLLVVDCLLLEMQIVRLFRDFKDLPDRNIGSVRSVQHYLRPWDLPDAALCKKRFLHRVKRLHKLIREKQGVANIARLN